jgi:molybdopterin-synthase adenylyltransferase
LKLRDLAYATDESGESRLVIEDRALLEWSAEAGIAPRAAQLEALEEGIIPLRYVKNFSALDIAAQTCICASHVLVCGCGGLGGALITLLARVGVGRLRLVDGDTFSASNLNRQWLCDTNNLAQPKAMAAAEHVRAVNPLVEVEPVQETMGAANAEDLIRGMDLVMDALDNLDGRFLLAGAARRLGVPFLHGAATGWWGQVATFLPDSPSDLTAIYGTAQSRDAVEIAMGVLGPAPSLIASLQVFEAIRLLSGRKPAYASRLLFFDGESGVMELLALSAGDMGDG